MTKQVYLSKDGKPVSFELERLRGEKLGKSMMSSGTVDFAANASTGYRVTLTTTPRDLVKKDKLRENIRKQSQVILGSPPIIFQATSTGLLVMEFSSGEEGKIVDVLAKAIQDTKLSGFWIF
jgi:hypothetical protein